MTLSPDKAVGLSYEDGYRAGLKFAITPNAQGNQRKAVELGLLDVRCNFATYGGPYICKPDYNLRDGVYRGGFIARIEGPPGQERIDRTNYIANAINFHEPLIEALTAMLRHSCVSDTSADDKFPEDHDAERAARKLIDGLGIDHDDPTFRHSEAEAAYERGRRDVLNAILDLNPRAAQKRHIINGGTEATFDNHEGKLPFDVVFWVCEVASQLGIEPREEGLPQ